MESDTQYTEKAYGTKDIATMVDIAVPTVRKYAQSLEKGGYQFIKNASGARVFVEKDAMALRYLKQVREETKISVEQAVNVVLARFDGKPIRSVSPPDTTELVQYKKQYDDRVDELEKKLELQNEMIQKLTEEMIKRENEMERREKDRDEKLMRQIREIQETKQLMIETTAAAEEERNLNFWERLFGKKK